MESAPETTATPTASLSTLVSTPSVDDHHKILIALVMVMLIAVLVRALIVVSYPISVAKTGGDYWRIAWQMVGGQYQGNLTRAGGYPFVLSWVLLVLQPVWHVSPALGTRLVLVLQHLCGLAVVCMVFDLLRRNVGLRAAVIGGVLVAVSPLEATWANQARPEFFLSFLLVLMFWLVDRASTARRARCALYGGVGVALALSGLARANGLAFAPVVLLAILCWPTPGSWRHRLWPAAVTLAAAAVITFTYLALLHHPSTGTWSYSSLLGWNLTLRLNGSGIAFDRANGPWSRALLRYNYADVTLPDRDLKPVDLGVRAEAAADPATAQRLRSAPDSSQASTTDIDYPKLFYCLGFEDADAVMTLASLETIGRCPLPYLAAVAESEVAYFRTIALGAEWLVPSPEKLNVIQEGADGFVLTWRRAGKFIFDQPSWVWLPGVRLLSVLYSAFTARWVLDALAFVAAGILSVLAPRRRGFIGLCWVAVTVWITLTSLVAPFSPRYRVPIDPFMDMLTAAVLAWGLGQLLHFRRQWSTRGWPKALGDGDTFSSSIRAAVAPAHLPPH